MGRICLLLAFLIAGICGVCAQTARTTLVLRGENNVQPARLVASYDGGYIMSGSANSYAGPTGQDLLIAKFDHNLNMVWRKVMGTARNERATALMETGAHDIVVAYSACDSEQAPNGDFAAIRIIKLAASGNTRWIKSYYHNKYCSAAPITGIMERADGKYAIFTNPYVLSFGDPVGVLVTDTGGNISTYQQVRNPSSIDYPHVARLGSDFIIAGSDDVNAITQNSIMYALCDASGNVRQSRRYGNAADLGPGDLCAMPDRNVLILGGLSTLAIALPFMLKVDTTGSLIWAKSYAAKDTLFTIAIAAANRVFLIGYSYIGGTANTNLYLAMAEIDTAGNFLWAKTAPVPNGFRSAVYNASDNTIVVGGLYYLPPYPAFLMRAEMSATLSCNEQAMVLQTKPYSIIANLTGTVTDTVSTHAVPTPAFTNGGASAAADSLICGSPAAVGSQLLNTGFELYPNPANAGGTLRIRAESLNAATTLDLFDIAGRLLYHTIVRDKITVIDRLPLTPGVYFARLTQSGRATAQKLIVE